MGTEGGRVKRKNGKKWDSFFTFHHRLVTYCPNLVIDVFLDRKSLAEYIRSLFKGKGDKRKGKREGSGQFLFFSP